MRDVRYPTRIAAIRANSEINIKIQQSIRGKDIVIVQTGAYCNGKSVNDHFVELLLLQDACYRSSAKTITIISPFFFYCRADKKDDSRCPISSAVTMDFITQKCDRLITTDLHSSQIQSFSKKPIDNLYCSKLLCDYLKDIVFKNIIDEGKNINEIYMLIGPDLGAVKRIESCSHMLGLNSACLTKNRDYTKENVVLNSSITCDKSLLVDKTIIMMDDMIDTMNTMLIGIKELKKYGIKNVIVVATHCVLSGSGIDNINACEDIVSVIVTNSISQNENLTKTKKLVVLDLGSMFGEVIRRLTTSESISALFE